MRLSIICVDLIMTLTLKAVELQMSINYLKISYLVDLIFKISLGVLIQNYVIDCFVLY